jgi:CPA1 family monovalent cation:H+ antiporter
VHIYTAVSLIIVVTALSGYINARFLKLPGAIGIMLISVFASIVIIATASFQPGIFKDLIGFIGSVDFTHILLEEMLSFLLFAGAIHINVHRLKAERLPILVFSTVGVFISTFIVGCLFYVISLWLGFNIDFLPCLLFGSLISPTDPIAVLSVLRQSKIPSSLEMKITGESLFNDGVSVVVFITIYEIMVSGVDNISIKEVGWLFLKEAGGGMLFGTALGYVGFLLLRSINNYAVEVMITLAIVMGGSLVAAYLHISTLLAMVMAGIITGNKSRSLGMSDETRDYVDKFWEMIDEVLNAILFLLIGLELLIIPFNYKLLLLGCITIGIVLLARFISVVIPVFVLRYKRAFEKNAVLILTWGGLRGGISIALALALPGGNYKGIIVTVTYIIVLFSILAQGLTIGKVAKKLAA